MTTRSVRGPARPPDGTTPWNDGGRRGRPSPQTPHAGRQPQPKPTPFHCQQSRNSGARGWGTVLSLQNHRGLLLPFGFALALLVGRTPPRRDSRRARAVSPPSARESSASSTARETCPAMLMITSSPAPDSASSATSVWRLSCQRPPDAGSVADPRVRRSRRMPPPHRWAFAWLAPSARPPSRWSDGSRPTRGRNVGALGASGEEMVGNRAYTFLWSPALQFCTGCS